MAASASHRVNVDVTNYDRDGDGLIEINSLAQLNAIRWDLDGDGQPAASISSYAAAFPARSESHGCPDTAADADTDPGPCLGYELAVDLDFDTNGDGAVNASDAYPSWTPIGNNTTRYTANFNGNGHTISNLTINITSGQLTGAFRSAGLFGHIVGDLVIENVGLTDVNITVNFGNGTALVYAGALVGYFEGALRTSYATGTIAATAGTGYIVTNVGGLVGYVGPTAVSANRIDATWAAVNVSATSSATGANNAGDEDAVGGLVGRLISDANTSSAVTASYARGTATATRSNSSRGGLVGISSGAGATATAGYWDTVTSSLTSSAGGTGQTTTALQTPTGYTGIYAAWNTDVDGDGNADDPWDFGTGSQYPVLKYASHDFAAQGRPFDYDADNDGLIDITTLAQLDAIRHDLNGDGDPAGAAGAAAFREAFPHRERSVAGRMGCQLTDHDSNTATPDQATCTGYELLNNLDFDTNGDGAVNASDDYPNWTPIGANLSPYTAAFNGNGHTISNMTINISGVGQIGLFGSANGDTLENVGLRDVSITAGDSNAQFLSVGGLAGYRRGAVRASYATGTINATVGAVPTVTSAGGLVGYLGFTTNTSQVDASWAAVNINVTSTSTITGSANVDAAGGLVGRMVSQSGTAVTVTASWARGTAASSRTGSGIGGLVGFASGTGVTVSASHWDTDTSGLSTSVGGAGAVGRTTTQLKMPTNYGASSGDTFFGWNIDMDGDSNNDDPWDFGVAGEYPVLKYGGHTLAAQGRTVVDYDDDNDGLIDIRSLAQLDAVRYDLDGNGVIATANAPAYRVAFPNRDRNAAGRMGCQLTDHDSDTATPDQATCTGYELRNSLDFDTDGDGSTHTGGVGDDGDDWYTTTTGTGQGWNPIGGHVAASPQPAYAATLEGNNYTIANLYINLDTAGDNEGRYVGLFGNIGSSGTVRNLGLVNPYVKNTRGGDGRFIYYGALAGNSDGAVSRVYVRGGEVAGGQTNAGSNNNYAGGLLGRSQGSVSDSYATCDATVAGGGRGVVGGLVGYNRGGTVRRSYAEGAVSSDYQGGGLVGFSGRSTGRISDSYATGAVATTGHGEAGGLVGFNNAGADIVDSYATGAVSSSGNGTGATDTNDVGGLVGEMTSPGSTVTGSYATGAVSTTGNYNALGGLVGFVENGATVTGSYAIGAVTVTAAASSNNSLGGLVGRLTGTTSTGLRASYATGAVSGGGGGTNNLGGLVGLINNNNPQIRASYAAGAVSASGSGTNRLGGLVGYADTSVSNYPRISASYAAGAVSATGSGTNTLGGLVGGVATTGRPVFTNVYWDTEATGQATSADLAGGSPQSTTALQNPTEYGTGIYAAWDVDADNVSGNDDPWDFGSSTQYPILQFGHDALSIARQTSPRPAAVDYDGDNDGLIDITTLAQLDAVRYDRDGDGRSVTGAGAVKYYRAFPGLTAMMGCTDGVCAGYELRADLDFDSDAAYADWTPIGTAASPYAGVFRGNGHSIANLAISSGDLAAVGLFGVVSGSNAVVESLGLTGVAITPSYAGAAAAYDVGALAGYVGDGGTVRGSYATGAITAMASGSDAVAAVGGLVGRAGPGAGIAASYAGVAVAANSTATAGGNDAAGGLVGKLDGAAGNLAAVTATYATGTAAASRENAAVGGLVGAVENATVSASYWDTRTSGIADDADDNPPEGKTSSQLKRPTRYTGIYAT